MKKNVRKTIIGLIIGYLAVIVIIQLIAPKITFTPETFPEGCPEGSLNCVFVGKTTFRFQEKVPLKFNTSTAVVMEDVLNWINIQPRTSIKQTSPEQVHAVFKTLIWRFPDDFVVKVTQEKEQTLLYVYSKSRLGRSDLGVNQKRVASFLNFIKNSGKSRWVEE